MRDVDIAICTFKRPHIAKTLHSIAQLRIPRDVRIRVIIADNDDYDRVRSSLERVCDEYGLPVAYVHAPARNISIARNACLDTATAPLLIFIDDDELVTPDWLIAMLDAADYHDADIILGPVHAQYPPETPSWMRQGDFHSTYPVQVKGKIITGYCGNVMIKRNSPLLQQCRFRLELGQQGGEDTLYFADTHRAGACIAYAPAAIVTEKIPADRLTLRWLIKRRFRCGQTHALYLREQNTNRYIAFIKAQVKILACIFFAMAHVLSTERRIFWLLRGLFHAGVIHGFISKPPRKMR